MEYRSKKRKNQYSYRDSSFLEDLTLSGKNRPWRKNKLLSLAVSQAYFLISALENYGQKIADCGSYLRFAACSALSHGKVLIEARFCKCRLCVTCQKRKSLVIRDQVFKLVHWHREKYKTDVPLLLTLTVLNVSGDNLKLELDKMVKAWQRLVKRADVRQAICSWFRALEITYNSERGDFHPHFHVLLMVPKTYFLKERGLYISQEKWLEIWQESMRDRRITQVDIRSIRKRGKGTLEKIIAEVAKYATKPSSYIKENVEGSLEVDSKVIKDLHYVLKNRRLVGFGGFFSKIRKEKGQKDLEDSDLIDIECVAADKRCECKICGSTLMEELYTWDIGLKQYKRKE